jgi:hypothetical protein
MASQLPRTHQNTRCKQARIEVVCIDLVYFFDMQWPLIYLTLPFAVQLNSFFSSAMENVTSASAVICGEIKTGLDYATEVNKGYYYYY